MAMIARISVLVFLVSMTIWLILRSTSAIDFRAEHLEGPAADKMVEYRGVRMRQGDFILHYVVDPKVRPIVSQRSSILWSLLYALYGLMGNYAYYLMRLVRGEKSRSPGYKAAARFAARTVLAGLCGVACFLLVKFLASPLLGNLVGSWIPNPQEVWTTHSISDGLLFVPFAAGIFIATFYQSIEGILQAFLDRIQKLIAGKEP